MKKIFISFADNNMTYSLKRIGKQAKKSGIFDEVILYNSNNLPEFIQKSPLMQYKRGAGYWAWKPAIIWETLQQNNEGDIIVYADAGCSIQNTSEWEELFTILNKKNTICFEYKDKMLEWSEYGQTSTKIKYWTKGITLSYFEQLLNDSNYSNKFNKIMGGFILSKGKNNCFIKHWLDITLHHPELILDPSENETNKNLAYHKHDQSIITPLAHYYNTEVVILPERSETSNESAIVASRIRAKNYNSYLSLLIKSKLRKLLGINFYNRMKKKFLNLIK